MKIVRASSQIPGSYGLVSEHATSAADEVLPSQIESILEQDGLLDLSSKVYQVFKECCSFLLEEEEIKDVFDSLINQQEQLSSHDISIIEPSDTCPLHLAVTKTSIFFLNAVAGEGAIKKVYYCNELDTVTATLNGGKVIKISIESFDRERKLLNKLSPESKKGGARSFNLDHADRYFIYNNGYVAIADASKYNLSNVDYTIKGRPVSYILKPLINYIDGLGSLHRSKIVHRDIKGDNLLVSPGKLADFEYSKIERDERELHKTKMTPMYAAPFIWRNILDQVNCTGHQGRESDIFAFGRTIQYDVIQEIIAQLGYKYGLPVKSVIEKMQPKTSEGNFTDEELIQLEATYPGQVIYAGSNKSDDGKESIVIAIFPTREELYKASLHGINLLKVELSADEITALRGLALIAYYLQNNNKEKLLDYESVKAALEEIQPKSAKRKIDFSEASESDEGSSASTSSSAEMDSPPAKIQRTQED